MATINAFVPSPTGTTVPTYASASGGGDVLQNPQGGILIIKNGGGSPITATLTTPGTLPNGDAYPDKVITVPATTGERWCVLGPEYVDANNQCAIAWSGTTSVTFTFVKP